MLNEIRNSYDEIICQVIGITGSSYLTYLENLIQIQFSVCSDSTIKSYLAKISTATTPILFFISSENMKVIYAHFVTPMNIHDQEFE